MKKVINLLFNDFTNDNRVLKESRSLQHNGFQVELIATHFDKNLPKEERIEGIEVRRVDVGYFKSLPINLAVFWIKAILKYRKANIFHANDLYALPPAYIIKKFFNKDAKIVYDCHEHETEAQIYVGKPLLKFMARIFEKGMIKSVDKILVVSKSIQEEYEEMYDIEKPTLILNCPYLKNYKGRGLFREKLNIPKDKIIFLYQGKYQPGRGIEKLVELFKKIKKVNNNLVLVLLTYGKDIEKLKTVIRGVDNIYWHDKIPPNMYMNYVTSADWGVHFMENTCKNHNYALPNKLFDYFMGNLPVVVSNLKEMSNFVNKHKVGYVIDLNNIEETIEIFKNIKKGSKVKFLENVEIVRNQYIWEKQEKKLIKLYKSII